MSNINVGSDNRSPKSILLVEDEAVIALNEAGKLKKHGFNVITAYNAKKAIETVRGGQVDLILMDIDLGRGKMDGTEAAVAILEERELPIVFLTSHIEKEMVEKVKGITRYGYVLKSAGEFVLIESINMAFELFEAHRQLRMKEIEAREVIDNVDSAILRFNTNGEILFFSKGAEKLFGFSAEEVLGRLSVETINPQIDSSGLDHGKMMLDIFNDPEKYSYNENENVKKDGTRLWMAWRNTAVCDGNGNKLYIQCIGNDITEQKRIERELRESEERFKKAFDSTHIAMAITRRSDGRVLEVNPGLLDLTGYAYDEVVGRTTRELNFFDHAAREG